jgi:8-oxo-dGTP pyrophosphatase MutT (NUDIX family)
MSDYKNRSKRIAICLICDYKDDILMGCRNDNKTWTVPGGHIEVNEDPYEGAIRELKEETGLDVEDIKLVGSHWDREKGLLLYLFKVEPDPKQMIDVSDDPDEECDSWHFMDPNDVKDNLHVPIERNIALKYWMKN